MKRFLGISLVCLSAMFVVGCDNGSEAPDNESFTISEEEKAAAQAYAKEQEKNPTGAVAP